MCSKHASCFLLQIDSLDGRLHSPQRGTFTVSGACPNRGPELPPARLLKRPPALRARISVPSLLSVAMMDAICPPSTVFAAYNVLGATDKTLAEYGFNDHEGGGTFQQKVQLDWLSGRL